MKGIKKDGNLKWDAAITYIWNYYKIPIIGMIVAISLVFYFAAVFFQTGEDEILNIQFVNFYDDVSETSGFAENFKAFISSENTDGKIVFDNNTFFNLAKSSEFSNVYYQKTVAYLEAGTIDGIICSYDNLMGIAQGGRLMDLRDGRTNAIYEKYKDRVVVFEREGEKIPVGIDISDSPVLNNMNGYADSCYIGISSNASHLELSEAFIDYLLE